MKRFTIKTNGTIKTLFTVREIKNKNADNQFDLNIHFPGQKKIRFPNESFQELINTQNGNLYQEYMDQHISIHCSPDSMESNTIKRTIMTKETRKAYYHVTPGIKRDKQG